MVCVCVPLLVCPVDESTTELKWKQTSPLSLHFITCFHLGAQATSCSLMHLSCHWSYDCLCLPNSFTYRKSIKTSSKRRRELRGKMRHPQLAVNCSHLSFYLTSSNNIFLRTSSGPEWVLVACVFSRRSFKCHDNIQVSVFIYRTTTFGYIHWGVF